MSQNENQFEEQDDPAELSRKAKLEAKHRAMIDDEDGDDGNAYKVVRLRKAVDYKGTRYESVRMREPRVRDQLALAAIKDNAKQEIAFLANLCEIPPEALHAFTSWDHKTLQMALLDFVE